MNQDELTSLIDKTATLMAQYERRGAAIDSRLQALNDTLQGMVEQLPVVVRTSADDVLQTLPHQMGTLMKDGRGRAMGGYRQRQDAAGHDVEKASHALATQISQLQRLHRQIVWKAMAAVVLALVLLLSGGAWLSLHYTRVILENQLSAELLKAYNRADVTLCGSGNLCANVDSRAPRRGERRQYLLVNPR